MDVRQAIRDADALLPGVPVQDGTDPRRQAVIAVGEFIETDPEPVWAFIRRWGGHEQEDLRNAIATCLMEHLLEHHFADYLPRVKCQVLADTLFGDMFDRCWRFGQSTLPGNAEAFDALRSRHKT